MHRTLQRLPFIGATAERCYWRYIRWRFDPTRLIDRAVGDRPEISVVVIGANDGPSTDPVYPLLCKYPGWRGTFVEPVPYLFEKLEKSYGASERFSFVNAAVSSSTGTLTFYYVSPRARQEHPHFPRWVEQLGSFDRGIITGCLDGKLEPYIVEIAVPTITLAELFARTALTRVDVLVIDTEGHDWKILQQLDLTRHRPAVIFFENCFLSPEEKQAAVRFLEGHYKVRDVGKDYLCTLRQPLSPKGSTRGEGAPAP